MQEHLDVEGICSSSREESYCEAQEDKDDDKDINEELTKKEKLAASGKLLFCNKLVSQ